MKNLIAGFLRNESANVALMLGLSAFPIMLGAGGAIDYSMRAAAVNSIQAAVDAAVLAGVAAGTADSHRAQRMEAAFATNLDPALAGHITHKDLDFETSSRTAVARVDAAVPNAFLRVVGIDTWAVSVEAEAQTGSGGTRVLDVGMCIDITGSMQSTIDAVRGRALNFERDVNAEIVNRSLPAFDAVRVRVIGYRDFGGNNAIYRSSHYKFASGGYVDKMPNPGPVWRAAGDYRNYGDDVPLDVSDYFQLPGDASDFSAFVGSLQANGGGDYPESGLECVNAAMDAAWMKPGDALPGGDEADAVFPMVVVWTDIDAQPPSHGWSLQNTNYPPADVMPRNYAGLKAKWDNPANIDQDNKLLVTFMPSAGATPVWNNLRLWDNYFSGGTLANGNTVMVDRIVDAIESLPSARKPVLTR